MKTAEKLEAEGEPASSEDEDGAQDETPLESVAELVEQLARYASRLALREAHLRAAHHASDVRLAAKAIAVALAGAVAFIATFALANWAAVAAHSSRLPGWRAPLMLCAAWAAVGAGLLSLSLSRARRAGLDVGRFLRADQNELVRNRELARDEAAQRLRASFDRVTDTVSGQARARVAASVRPIVGGALSAGEAIVEQIDGIAKGIDEAVPGGGLTERVADLALTPGRYVVKLARMATRVPPTTDVQHTTSP